MLLKALPLRAREIASLTDQLHQINGRVQAGLGRLKIEECDILNADTAYEYEWKLQETAQAYIELRELKYAFKSSSASCSRKSSAGAKAAARCSKRRFFSSSAFS